MKPLMHVQLLWSTKAKDIAEVWTGEVVAASAGSATIKYIGVKGPQPFPPTDPEFRVHRVALTGLIKDAPEISKTELRRADTHPTCRLSTMCGTGKGMTFRKGRRIGWWRCRRAFMV